MHIHIIPSFLYTNKIGSLHAEQPSQIQLLFKYLYNYLCTLASWRHSYYTTEVLGVEESFYQIYSVCYISMGWYISRFGKDLTVFVIYLRPLSLLNWVAIPKSSLHTKQGAIQRFIGISTCLVSQTSMGIVIFHSLIKLFNKTELH